MPDDNILSIHERLALVYERLDQMPPATTADEAFNRLCEVLDQVEDQHSGVVKNPNPGLKFDGRMYPPRADFTTRGDDGSIHATTKGNEIHALPDGTLSITKRHSDEEVYRRAGAGSPLAEKNEAARRQEQERTATSGQAPRPSQAAIDAANARSTTAKQPPSSPSTPREADRNPTRHQANELGRRKGPAR